MAQRRIDASFLYRRDTAANWESKNPVLSDGERIAVHTNAGAVRYKIGDGEKKYTQLPFDDEPLYNALAEKCYASNSVEVTLLVGDWKNAQQTATVIGLGVDQNGVAGLSQVISDDQYDAAVAAEMHIVGQTENSVTIACNGDVPQVDIPIVIILLG